jgi:tRNA(Ile2) C34 agmatinyltransferase TiaS
MSQKSKCNRCGNSVSTDMVSEGRAFFTCDCGRNWSTKAFYGKKHMQTATVLLYTGIGSMLGPVGTLFGFIAGCMEGNRYTSKCIVCGGTGYQTRSVGNRTGYQCEKCHSTWLR